MSLRVSKHSFQGPILSRLYLLACFAPRAPWSAQNLARARLGWFILANLFLSTVRPNGILELIVHIIADTATDVNNLRINYSQQVWTQLFFAA